MSNKTGSEEIRLRGRMAKVYTKYEALGLGGKDGVSEKLVRGSGPIPCKVMLIGEAPGAEEDKAGKPFVGSSGNRLNALLELSRLSRKEVYITNVFKYRPPENRTPLIYERLKSYPCLQEEIEIVDPRLIILLGSTAVQTIYPGQSVNYRRGKIDYRPTSNRYIVSTFHPAVTLYSSDGTVHSLVKKDFEGFGELIKEKLK